jgi:cytochrome c553
MKLLKLITMVSILGALSVSANEGALLYKSCAGCHGINGEKKALGKSEIITGWEKEKTIKALNGYKDGTYGKAMKGVMKGQVTRLDDAKIEALASYIETLKQP